MIVKTQSTEAKYNERLVEDAVDVIWSSDIDGRFTYLSRQFQTLFGFDPVECIGARNLDFVHPDDHEYLVEAVKNLLKGRTSKNKEFRHRCFDGSYIWVMVKASLVRSNDYQVIGLQGIIRDISDRKETELALRDSQEQFRKITENVPGIIYRFVHRVSDGQAAIEAAEEQLPTVILMDVQMPGVDGLSAMKQIRKNKKLKNTQIIALTGLAMEGDRKRCLEAGADHYLSKPFRMQSIIETIEQSITRA